MSDVKYKTYSGRTIARSTKGRAASSTPGSSKGANCKKSPLKNFGMKYNPYKGMPKNSDLSRYSDYLKTTKIV